MRETLHQVFIWKAGRVFDGREGFTVECNPTLLLTSFRMTSEQRGFQEFADFAAKLKGDARKNATRSARISLTNPTSRKLFAPQSSDRGKNALPPPKMFPNSSNY